MSISSKPGEILKALENLMELEITCRGRKSGKEITTPVWFVTENRKLYLLPMYGSDTNWYRNIIADSTTRIKAHETVFTRTAVPILEANKVSSVAEKFRVKYSPSEIKKYYTKLDVALEISI